MKVILNADVKGKGHKGDVINRQRRLCEKFSDA